MITHRILKRISVVGSAITVALLCLSSECTAEAQTVRVMGRKEVVVTTAQVSLGDIADITSQKAGNDEALIALKKLNIAEAPRPGKTQTISAAQILDRLRSQGVDLNSVGYSLPRVVSIKRAGRPIEVDEIKAVIEAVLNTGERDAVVRGVEYEEPVFVAPGELELSARVFESQQPGQLGFSFEAKTDQEKAQRFDIMARIDEWREVPVAARPLGRGTVINASDIQMARFNVSDLPRDVALHDKSVYGLETSQTIGIGEVFRKGKLAIPPLVTVGSVVTLLYRVGALEATATGVALEAGAEGDSVKVRNNSSKKIVVGKVLEPGVVGVGK